MTAPPDDTTTDLHAVIAALRAERDAAVAREAKRDSDYAERAAHQGATVEVLQAMAVSPGDPKPVFELIVRRARDLCDGYGASLAQVVDSSIVLHAYIVADEALGKRHEAGFPRPVAADTIFGRAILAREPVQIPDVSADETFALRESTLRSAVRALVAVPLIRNGEAIGAIDISRRQTGEFSQAQIELLQVLANQAVIAINSAETYRALQTRTSDLQETLEYQTATSDVLKVISRSAFDLQPVLDTVIETAARLCSAEMAGIARREGDLFRRAGQLGFPADITREMWGAIDFGNTVSGRAAREGRIIHVLNVADEPNYPEELIRIGKQRSSLGVPLLRGDEVIGVMLLARQRVEPFTDRQIELVSTFADQAVIAIENTRLITEQREALEQQTATAEVLQVINASPGNLVPVFDAMLERAMRLCGGTIGGIFTFDGDHSVTSAVRGVTAAFQEYNDKYPMDKIQPGTLPARIIETRGPVQNPDVTAGENYRAGHPYARALVELGGIRAVLAVPLLKDGVAVGMVAIYRQEAGAFSDKQIALLQNFAAQAVIAIENARLLTEQQEALEQQTATAEVLQVINASPGNLAPVFDAILEKAMRLCEAAFGELYTFDGENFTTGAHRGIPAAFADFRNRTPPADAPGSMIRRIREGANVVHIADVKDDELYLMGEPTRVSLVDLGGARTVLTVALRKDGSLLGFMVVYRQEVRLFSDRQVTLLQNFATQAVIAMENARLLNEQAEALEQQTATAEVLQVINASPGNLVPVFDAILEKAHNLCSADHGSLYIADGEAFRAVAVRGMPDAFADLIRQPFRLSPNHPVRQLIAGTPFAVVHDASEDDDPIIQKVFKLAGIRSALFVPLRKDKVFLGYVVASSPERRAFTGKQVALLQNFAAQAVIAMENARLLDEIRQRQAELRVTFDNMGDGVVMFDGKHHLAAWNRNFQELLDIPDAALAKRPSYADYLRLLADRGEFGSEDVEAELARRLEHTDRELRLERARPDGRVIEVRRNAVPDGGFVLIYSDITERKRSEEEVRAARDAAETAYRDLKAAQANLIQAEKMASLGQLTAGIAHEIKNPLNFVNNFAELSGDLLNELNDAVAGNRQAEIDELSATLQGNLAKITEHGKRADGIVKAMLEHSRGSSGERRRVDLNALIDEALNLAYHGARAQDQTFNITLERDFGAGIAPIEVNPQDITRVFLNVFSNGFYAATRRAREGGDAGFVPTLKVTTIDAGEAVEIRVRDNGTGIPADIRDKLFQPFFTTKPTGEGTGLGLSITYDIVTQQHGGAITVDSEVGNYSEFTVRLPRNP